MFCVQSVRMCHALRRISYTTCEAPRALFAFVAREPRCEPTSQYCHAFETDSPEQVNITSYTYNIIPTNKLLKSRL